MSRDTSKKRKLESDAGDDQHRSRKPRVLASDPGEAGQIPAQGEDVSNHTISRESGTRTKLVKKKGQSRQEKSERRSKKNKKPKTLAANPVPESATLTLGTEIETDDFAGGEDFVPLGEVEDPKSAKKAKKALKRQQQQEQQQQQQQQQQQKKKKKEDAPSIKSSRFIVFVGNLPYDTTESQIEAHFSKLAPISIRHRTDKKTGHSKGFAFLEFDAVDKMNACLKLYHHSIFNSGEEAHGGQSDDVGKEKGQGGRKINVELTAGGGGGKSQDRKDRIKAKNKKLDGEREKRRLKEKAKQEKALQKKKEEPATGANASSSDVVVKDDRAAIHPSRLSRVPY